MKDNNEKYNAMLELLKAQMATASFLYIVLGFSLTAITAQNDLLFRLAGEGSPNKFIPYWPLFAKLFEFTIINIGWVIMGLLCCFNIGLNSKGKSFIIFLNIIVFVISLVFFAYIMWGLLNVFKF